MSMKNKLLFILFFLFPLFVFGQKKDYFVVFCGKEASQNSLGHAFIMIGKGDPFTCNIDGGDGEAFGLYAQGISSSSCKPDGLNAAKSYFIGKLPGCLFNDINTKVSNYLVIRCTFEEYLTVQMEVENWKNKNYELKKQDCVSFVIAVAKLFDSQLVIPSRSGFDNFPNKFILKLKNLNK